jgi:hypothetical protein
MQMSWLRTRRAGIVVLGVSVAVGVAAWGGALATPGSASESTVTMHLQGWPAIEGLGVRVDGRTVRPGTDGGFSVRAGSSVTFLAGDLALSTITAKEQVTLFDLVAGHECGSGTALARTVSALLALSTQPDGPALALPPASGAPTRSIETLSDAELLAYESASRSHRSVALGDALLSANRHLDAETWQESVASRATWTNDFRQLSQYLDRAIAKLAAGGANAPAAFGSATVNEILTNATAFRTQGLAYDGQHVIFSSRYALQITDPTYIPLKTVPWVVPNDIFAAQVAGASNPFNPDFSVNTSHDFDGLSHIGDIDVYDGKIYAPIEDENVDPSQNAFIALFDAKTLAYTGEKHQLPPALSRDGVPWVAVDGPRGVLYTAEWDPIPVLHVWDRKTFAHVGDDKLIWPTDPISGATIPLKRIQGAKVLNGMLYASADTKDTADPGLNTKTKRVWKIDPVTGYVSQVIQYDMPNRSEAEGLAFAGAGRGLTLNVIVLGPYDPAYSDAGYELSGDDWNANSTLRHYRRTRSSLRDQLCSA